MQILRIFDAQNYDISWKRVKREAVRAIIFKGDQIALVKCGKEGYYKFPGGGMEPNETHAQALVRETLEETGLKIVPQSIRGFGTLIEKRRSIYGECEIFEQHSHYYFADVEAESAVCRPDAYEAELEYHLEYAGLETAWKADVALGNNYESAFLVREAFILELLMHKAGMAVGGKQVSCQ